LKTNNEKGAAYLIKGAQIRDDIAKLLTKSLGIPVYPIDPKSIENVYNAIVKEAPELKNIFTEDELRGEVSNFIIKVVTHTNREELGKRVNEFIEDLKHEKEYEAILLLKGLIELPIGTKIGTLEIIEKDDKREKLMEHIKYLEKKKIIDSADCSWARVKFKSHRTSDLSEVLYKILEIPYSVLSIIMRMNLDVRDTVGAIYSPKTAIWFLGTDFRPCGWSRYRAEAFGKYMSLLSSISQKEKPTRLEQKIMQAIQVFWLSRLSTRTEIRFLILISAFESLLLTPSDKDYLGLKLAEKTAFLLENAVEKRIRLFKLMKRYYGIRSALVHEGVNKITEADDRTAENIFKNLVFKVLDLTASYKKMEHKSQYKDTLGIEDYIESLKFS
jgi:hypothetical protein